MKKSRKDLALMALSPNGKSLVLDKYAQFFIGAISNKLLKASAKTYPKQFGINMNEWRTLAMLAIESDITATQICDVIGFDKAAVSRSIRRLEDNGYVSSRGIDSHNRARQISLTTAGRKLHDAVLRVALQREEELLDGLSDNRRSQLLRSLKIIHENAVRILNRAQ